jgi:hypothetical protein
MKKAKLMLSALGVCALLATAFAFKAKTFDRHILYFNNGSGTGCTVDLSGKTFTTATTGTQVRASIASVSSDCPLTYTVNIDN